MRKLITFFLLLLPYAALAQVQIQGTVVDTEGKPIHYARVMAQDPADSTVCGYAFTRSKGEYLLRIRCNIPNVILSVSSMEIEKQSILMPNRSQRVDWTVKHALHEIKSVNVYAQKLWGRGDTLSYSVAAFAKKNDFLLKDVLNKMPGINVEPSGLIRYKGRPISRFYIENMDALQGSYGIATNNIAAKDIATVQV